ncbi:MAG: fibronectin type III domain-containing protein [Anaerolineae bacterium]|nr:fibronectin type III domain-containing protein [Anaerolineae bacterium]
MKGFNRQIALFIGLILFALVLVAFIPNANPASQVGAEALGAGREVVVRYDDRFFPFYVPPPKQAELGIQAATINVNWNPASCTGTVTAWPNDAKNAFLHAANIWASLLTSNVPIEVDACWRSDLPSGVLGSAGARNYYRNFANAPTPNTWYAVALANSLANSDLDPGVADIRANFSSTFSWYYGTDGNPGGQLDFVSVVLHELCHGLGFIGFLEYSGGVGKDTTSPASFDLFSEDGNSATKLLNYPNNSVALGNALLGNAGGVYFNGTNANAANGGTRVKLYTPSTWDSGSSYSHVDEIFNGTANALMTYSLASGEAEHNPGPVVLGIFKDMGWTVAGSPDPPTGLSATTSAQNQINLAWTDNSSDEDGFKIERSLTGAGPWAQIATVVANVTTYNDVGLFASATYYYRVRAYNSLGDSTYAGPANDTTSAPPGGAPTAPSNLSATQVSPTQINLAWTDNSISETGFKIERSANGLSGWTQIGTTGPNVTTYSNTVVAGVYYYHVRAYNGSGDSNYSLSATNAQFIYVPVILRRN